MLFAEPKTIVIRPKVAIPSLAKVEKVGGSNLNLPGGKSNISPATLQRFQGFEPQRILQCNRAASGFRSTERE